MKIVDLFEMFSLFKNKQPLSLDQQIDLKLKRVDALWKSMRSYAHLAHTRNNYNTKQQYLAQLELKRDELSRLQRSNDPNDKQQLLDKLTQIEQELDYFKKHPF